VTGSIHSVPVPVEALRVARAEGCCVAVACGGSRSGERLMPRLFHELAHGDGAQMKEQSEVAQALRATLLALIQQRLQLVCSSSVSIRALRRRRRRWQQACFGLRCGGADAPEQVRLQEALRGKLCSSVRPRRDASSRKRASDSGSRVMVRDMMAAGYPGSYVPVMQQIVLGMDSKVKQCAMERAGSRTGVLDVDHKRL